MMSCFQIDCSKEKSAQSMSCTVGNLLCWILLKSQGGQCIMGGDNALCGKMVRCLLWPLVQKDCTIEIRKWLTEIWTITLMCL